MKILKRIYIFSIVILCIFQIVNIIKITYPSLNSNKNDMSEYIIGRWVGEFPNKNINGNSMNRYEFEFYRPNLLLKLIYLNRYQINYSDASILVVDRNNGRRIQNNLVFYYTFKTNDQITLHSRLLDDWKLYRDGEGLIVNSTNGLIENGHYERKPVIIWLLVSLIIGIIPIKIINIHNNCLMGDNKKQVITNKDKILKNKPFESLIYGIFNLILFCIGLLIGIYYWRMIPIWRIRLPWDGIISFEIGLTFIVISLKIFKYKENIKKLSNFIEKYFSVFLFGIGLGIILISILKIAFFLYFGHYPEN